MTAIRLLLAGIAAPAIALAPAAAGDYSKEEKAHAFRVTIPKDWDKEWDPKSAPGISLHLKSPHLAETGGNCPIVSELHTDSQIWPGMRVDEKSLWRRVFARTGFTDIHLEVIERDETTPPYLKSAVKATFMVNDKRLQAKQALYWTPSRVWKDKMGRYSGAQIYFVNCTVRDQAEHVKKEKAGVGRVFESFRPLTCTEEDGDRVCTDLVAELPTDRETQGSTVTVSADQGSQDPLSQIVDAGVRAATGGAH